MNDDDAQIIGFLVLVTRSWSTIHAFHLLQVSCLGKLRDTLDREKSKGTAGFNANRFVH